MICFNFNNDCTGCRACADVCPKHCISFKEDNDGFVMPSFVEARCINCGYCERVCPAQNYQVEPYAERKCYVVYHKNDKIRADGSSGSVFYALAEMVIEKLRGEVYAAAFDDNLQLHHIRAIDMDGVHLQMKSKYIQSDTSGIYNQILIALRGGKEVLFVGTPCQCQALHNMTPPQMREKLLLVDFICHGVPSQDLFNKSIKQFEQDNKGRVLSFSFREKTKETLRNYKIIYKASDGQTLTRIGDLDEIHFCVGYFNHLTIRNSCYQCKQRTIERAADVTLGDFWGISEICPELADCEKGYSSLIVNTEKGGRIVELLSSCVINEVPDGVRFVTTHNRAYTTAENKSLMRNVFFWCLRHLGYKYCEKHFLTMSPPLLDRLLNSIVIRIDRIRNFSLYG